MRRSRALIRIITMMMVLGLAAGAGRFTVFAAGGTSEDARQSSFEYKKYLTDDLYKKALRAKMKSVYGKIGEHMDDSLTIPIPGLVETYTYAKGRMTGSDQFVPQGICRAGDYWLITAYDAEKKNNSVIYVVSPERRELVSTIMLPNKFHAGGIAFDGEEIWLTGDTSDKYKGNPFLQYIRYEDLLKMAEEPFHIVSDDEISEAVYIKNKPSFLECDNGMLWVGTYIGSKSSHDAYMYGYRIENTEKGAALNTIAVSVISGIDSSAQGADIEDDYLYVSSSYKGAIAGIKSSFVTKYSIRPVYEGRTVLDVEGREVKRIEVPKMNEELLVENGRIHLNFESATEVWRTAVINTDRILAVDQSLWN